MVRSAKLLSDRQKHDRQSMARALVSNTPASASYHVEIVTPKGVLLPAVCHASATHEDL